jgi:RNA polymerase sigma factor (TIGR02999 family)
MADVTQILNAIDDGDPDAAERLLPLVYDELRRLASRRLADERPGQTLQATALVHEAYLRPVANPGAEPHWTGRGHFFAAAAEAMRRILVERARHKRSRKAGGTGSGWTWPTSRRSLPGRTSICSPSTRPWTSSAARTGARPTSSSCASSPG